MSFQDVGKNSSVRRAASATLQQSSRQPAIPEANTWSGFGSGSSENASVGQISDSLNQYQRNVGILEKIAQQLQASGISSTTSNLEHRVELEQQYKVQLDVLRQLEQRVREQLLAQRRASTVETKKQALIKLERDFERVQGTAQNCRTKVTRYLKNVKQQQKQSASDVAMSSSSGLNSFQQEQERFQLQIQEDRLREEIMREREEEIRNINKGMHQVNEIYKDLAHIVGSQQEQVDQIETQMEESKANAESGLSQVQQANDRSNSSQCTIS